MTSNFIAIVRRSRSVSAAFPRSFKARPRIIYHRAIFIADVTQRWIVLLSSQLEIIQGSVPADLIGDLGTTWISISATAHFPTAVRFSLVLKISDMHPNRSCIRTAPFPFVPSPPIRSKPRFSFNSNLNANGYRICLIFQYNFYKC